MRQATFFSATALLAGCVSEQVTYQRDLEPNHISRNARAIFASDGPEIARLMAHRTNQPIICVCAGQGKARDLLFVYTAYIGAHDRGDYGSFTLQKLDGQWKVLKGGTDLDPIFACIDCPRDG